jgi:hypothetical protein
MRILRILKRGTFVCLVFLLGLAVVPVQAQASGTPRTETLKAGPYSIEVTLSLDPHEVEKPLSVTLVTRDAFQFSGYVTAVPGPGTDAIVVRAPLAPAERTSHTLVGVLHLPVRGVWQIVIDLDGPSGHGSASLDVTVSAPNALPLWLGWLIGLSPLIGCAWLIWQQWQYRRRLLASRVLEKSA